MKPLLIALALVSAPAVFAQSTFHGNNSRSGIFDSPSIRKTPSLKWQFKAGGPIISSPALSGGVLFFGSADSFLYAVDRSTGKEKWKFETGAPVSSSPAVTGGTVYFTGWDGNVYALDEETGKVKWKFKMQYERKFQGKHLHGQEPAQQTIPDTWDFFSSSPAVENGVAYVGSGDGNVYALDATTGEQKWKFTKGRHRTRLACPRQRNGLHRILG